MQSDAPRCPVHVAVAMVAIEPEIQRGNRYGRLSFLRKKTAEQLRSKPRWKCPVAGCKRCHVDDDLISRG